MPRLRQVTKAEVTSPVVAGAYEFVFGDRDPVAEPGTDTGTRGDWWTVFALVPDVLEHAVAGFALYGHPRRRLPPDLRELAQARAGWAAGSSFVFSQHCASLRALGTSEEKIAAIPGWAAAAEFEERERLVLAYADCLVLDRGRVPDRLFDALRAELGDEQVLELTYVTALYLQHAVMARALRLELDDRPEPVAEVGRRDEGPR